jgi:hypothetical protein
METKFEKDNIVAGLAALRSTSHTPQVAANILAFFTAVNDFFRRCVVKCQYGGRLLADDAA